MHWSKQRVLEINLSASGGHHYVVQKAYKYAATIDVLFTSAYKIVGELTYPKQHTYLQVTRMAPRQKDDKKKFMGVASGLGNNVNNMIGAGTYVQACYISF